jgi:predicted DCC family thiol-disulfide oxidoreductase YuxK
MNTLTIFHDPKCGLCAKFKSWLESQPTRVRVEFLAYDSAAAERKFPGLAALGAGKDVVVLADDGRWWQGPSAWITCLWATAAYREWAFRLASPALLPMVGKVVQLLSENRLRISHLLRLHADASLAQAIQSLPTGECRDGACPTFQHQPASP